MYNVGCTDGYRSDYSSYMNILYFVAKKCIKEDYIALMCYYMLCVLMYCREHECCVYDFTVCTLCASCKPVCVCRVQCARLI